MRSMEISNKHIDEFMRLYEKRFGKPIARDDAILQAEKLVRLFRFFRRKRYEKLCRQSKSPDV